MSVTAILSPTTDRRRSSAVSYTPSNGDNLVRLVNVLHSTAVFGWQHPAQGVNGLG
jgi:hypothetical protein